MDRERVEIALRLHPDASVDRRNLEQRIDDPWQRDKLLELVRALGADFSLGVTDDVGFAAASLTASELAAVVTAFARPERPGSSHWLVIARSIGKDAAARAGRNLWEGVGTALRRLLPVYHFVAWSRDNDCLAMKKVLSDEQRARRQ